MTKPERTVADLERRVEWHKAKHGRVPRHLAERLFLARTAALQAARKAK